MGIANTKFFILFLFYTFVFCVIAVFVSVSFYIHRLTVESESYPLMLASAVVIFCGFFFAIFTSIMFVDIVSVVRSGITGLLLLFRVTDRNRRVEGDENGLYDLQSMRGSVWRERLLPLELAGSGESAVGRQGRTLRFLRRRPHTLDRFHQRE